MIRSNDNVMIGLSGGKDSLVLTLALAVLKKKSPIKFNITACLIDHSDGALNTERIENFLNELEIPLHIILHPTFKIIKDREERSPCSLCANLRRGILASTAKEIGSNVIALGHNKDDAVETILLNLFYTGQFKCFHPNLYMSRSDVRTIRPLIYVEENNLNCEAIRLNLPITNITCDYGETSKRKYAKKIVASLENFTPELKSNLIHALKNVKNEDTWIQNVLNDTSPQNGDD